MLKQSFNRLYLLLDSNFLHSHDTNQVSKVEIIKRNGRQCVDEEKHMTLSRAEMIKPCDWHWWSVCAACAHSVVYPHEIVSGVELKLGKSVGRMRAYTRNELHRLFVVGSRIISVVV